MLSVLAPDVTSCIVAALCSARQSVSCSQSVSQQQLVGGYLEQLYSVVRLVGSVAIGSLGLSVS